MKAQALAFLVLAAALPGPAAAETVRIITPYIGSVTNEVSFSHYHLKDTGGLYGLSAQWVNTEKFQATGFYYLAPDINYSNVKDLQLSFDYYLKPSKTGKWMAGGGLDDEKTDMSVGQDLPPYISMHEDMLLYYLRAGRYFYYKKGFLDASMLPYAGYARQKTTGEIKTTVPGHTTIDIDESDSYRMAGLNLSATLAHFIGLQANWMGRFGNGERLDEYSLIASIYLNKRWNLTYRHKYKDYGSSFNRYNLASISYRF